MQVAEILTEKGDRVVTTRPESKVFEVAKTLREERIGAVLVVGDDGQVAGILSERDIVRSIADHGTQSLDMSVEDLMTRSLITCSPDSDTEELMEQMMSGQVRHLPVFQDKDLVGIVSVSDVVRNVLSELKWVRSVLSDQVVRSAAWATDED